MKKVVNNLANSPKNNKSFSFQSIIRLVIGILFVIGIGLGIGFTIPKITSSYENRGDFTYSYDFRIKLDVDPTWSANETLPKVESTANTLSNYLKQHGVAHYDTKYEFYDDKKEAYLSVNLPNETVNSKLVSDGNKKVDCDPFLSFFTNVVNPNKTLVYKWWGINKKNHDANHDANVYSILDFNEIFDINGADTKATTNTNGQNGILWRISKTSKTNITRLQNIYIDFYRYANQKEEERKDKTVEPMLFVINDLNGLTNKVNYHLINYSWNKGTREYSQIYDDTDDYHNFVANEICKDKVYDVDDVDTKCHLDNADLFKDENKKQSYDKDKIENGDLFRFINPTNYNKYKWLQQYVEHIYDFNTYEEFFPKKITNVYENKINVDDIDMLNIDSYYDQSNVDLNYVWYENSTIESSRKYLDDYKNYHWDIRQKPFSDTNNKPTMENFYSFINNYKKQAIFSNSNLFQGNVVISLSIGLAIFSAALLIVLLCLYKLFGLLGWLCLMLTLSLSSMILLSIVGIAFTLSFLIGLYCLMLMGTLMITGICERIKRQAKNGYDISLYVRKGFGRSLSQSIDVSFITLVFGILFTYMSINSLIPLGTILILGSMFAFFICFGLNFLISFLLFGDISMPNIWKWVFKSSHDLSLNSGNVFSDNNVFYFDCYCEKTNKTKLEIFTKKAFFALGFVGLTLIAGWILFGMFGIFSPKLFSQNNILLSTIELNGLSNVASKTNVGNYWQYILTSSLTTKQLNEIANNAQLTLGKDLIYQNVLSKSNFDITLTSWFVIAIASLAISFYLGLRHNWTAILPALITNLIVLLLFVAINSIFFIKFDENSIFGLIITMFVANVVITSHINLVNSSWKRQNSYSNFEFRHLINTTLKNSFWFWMVSIVSVVCFCLLFAISGPSQTWWLSIISFIGLIIIIGIVPWTISYLLYWNLLWRNAWIGSKEKKEKINYDLIDEQEIKGINCK